MYRLNTYPFIHVGFLHALFNVFALTPLLERFEAENGTLVSLAMFAGRSSTSANCKPLLWLLIRISAVDVTSRVVHPA